MEMSMVWQDWVAVFFGVISIAIGFAFFFSPAFGKLAYDNTTQGNLWKSLVGEKWAPMVAKFVFSLGAFAFGGWLIYSSVMGLQTYK